MSKDDNLPPGVTVADIEDAQGGDILAQMSSAIEESGMADDMWGLHGAITACIYNEASYNRAIATLAGDASAQLRAQNVITAVDLLMVSFSQMRGEWAHRTAPFDADV